DFVPIGAASRADPEAAHFSFAGRRHLVTEAPGFVLDADGVLHARGEEGAVPFDLRGRDLAGRDAVALDAQLALDLLSLVAGDLRLRAKLRPAKTRGFDRGGGAGARHLQRLPPAGWLQVR